MVYVRAASDLSFPCEADDFDEFLELDFFKKELDRMYKQVKTELVEDAGVLVSTGIYRNEFGSVSIK